MTNIRQNRIVLAAMAALAIIAGLLLVGGMSSAHVSDTTAPQQGIVAHVGNGGDQDTGFLVRDYAEFSDPGSDFSSSDWIGLLTSMIVKLALVVGVIYLIAWALRRYSHRGRAVVQDKKPIALLSLLNLSPTRTVYLLEVGRKVLVVGATQNQLSLLTEVTDPEGLDEVHSLCVGSSSPDQFSSLVNALRQQFSTRESALSNLAASDCLQQGIGIAEMKRL
jgi:flagellar biogenesis protein FliO